MSTPDLKTCPICGAKPEMHEYLMGGGRLEYAVWCMNGRYERTHVCYTYSYSTPEQAAGEWNRRTNNEECKLHQSR